MIDILVQISQRGDSFVLNFGPDTVKIILNGTKPVPDGTYDLAVTIVTTTQGLSESDSVQVIVRPDKKQRN